MATVKRRPKSDGTASYRVIWREGGSRDGAWQSETFVGKADAARFCREVDSSGQCWPDGWIKGIGYPVPADAKAAVTPFLGYAQSYVRDLTGVTPATRQRYDRQVGALDSQLQLIIGAHPTMENLEDVHVRRWVNARETAGARPKTIANYHGLLFMVFASAAQRGLRPGNPCAGTRLPDRYSPNAGSDHDVVFLTELQFGLLADCMFPDAEYPRAASRRSARMLKNASGRHTGTIEDRWLIEATVGTGLRWSEVTALLVADLELEAAVPRLSVKRAWKRNPKGEFARIGEGASYLGEPKTRKARRRITLSPTVVAVFRRAIAGKGSSEFVFTAPRGGPLNQPTWYEDRWRKTVDLAVARGLTLTPRFHDLRHTHAAWLIVRSVASSATSGGTRQVA